jgi:hypothetical protein
MITRIKKFLLFITVSLFTFLLIINAWRIKKLERILARREVTLTTIAKIKKFLLFITVSLFTFLVVIDVYQNKEFGKILALCGVILNTVTIVNAAKFVHAIRHGGTNKDKL